MIDKYKKGVDNNKVFGELPTDLSKALDYICHDLLVAKTHAYRLSLPSLKMIQDYLGSSCSKWENRVSNLI